MEDQLTKVADTDNAQALVTNLYHKLHGPVPHRARQVGAGYGPDEGTDHLGPRHGRADHRLRVIAENLANQDTTGDTPGADPYRRKTVTFEQKMDTAHLGAETVKVKNVGTDKAAFPKRYDPSHPPPTRRATSRPRTSTASSR